ncbi:MAG: PLP-dependent aminotransferase family protein, partial [Pseudomonas sp.]|nr:PLP-dependent aminotransferase family protein [Pseudomonas sp.]
PEIRAGMDIACNLQVENEQEAFARLQAAGIDALPLASYCVEARPPGLVMGFAPYEERAIEDAARAVAHILRG